MQNNIEMERVWQEESFFEIEITCTAETIKVSTKIYVTDTSIDELSNKIKMFLDGNYQNTIWENGTQGDDTLPYISFKFIKKDSLGHLQIEVFIEIDDGGSLNKHNCCFFINTEYGLLYKFSSIMQKIKQKEIGQKIALYEMI